MKTPAKPEWKQSKSDFDKERQVQFRLSPLHAALPLSSYRLAYLKDPDAQFTSLLDHLQEHGIPMGSETWALRAELLFRQLHSEHQALHRLLRDWRGNQEPDIQRLADEVDHARQMRAKYTPPMQTICDCCGWPGARAIGDGWAACLDCLPEEPLSSSNPSASSPSPAASDPTPPVPASQTLCPLPHSTPPGPPSSTDQPSPAATAA